MLRIRVMNPLAASLTPHIPLWQAYHLFPGSLTAVLMLTTLLLTVAPGAYARHGWWNP